jgi:hypothetical protein
LHTGEPVAEAAPSGSAAAVGAAAAQGSISSNSSSRNHCIGDSYFSTGPPQRVKSPTPSVTSWWQSGERVGDFTGGHDVPMVSRLLEAVMVALGRILGSTWQHFLGMWKSAATDAKYIPIDNFKIDIY